MKMTIKDYLAQLDHAKSTTATTDAATIQQAATLKAGLKFIIDQLDAGYLAKYVWQVAMANGEPVEVSLETNLINVPMAEAARLDPKLLEGEDDKPVKLYLVGQSADLNVSGLRIDEVAVTDDLNASDSAIIEKMQTWVSDQLAKVTEKRLAADGAK